MPIAWLGVVPASVAGAMLLVLAARDTRESRIALAAVGGLFTGGVGLGVSQGRHFAALPLRAAFVGALVVAGATAAVTLTPRASRAWRQSRRGAAIVAALAALLLEVANHLILPRLYPAFHWGLVGLTGALGAPVGSVLRDALGLRGERPRPLRGFAIAGVALVLVAAIAPRNARRLALADNLRFIFFERAPLLAVGVEAAARLAPPLPLDPMVAADEPRPEGRLEIDWRERDILLVSVDALRADHVGAYGYARPTTPNLDRLAAEGTVFSRAYCPTPHTSYSVTSMMTGKNLRSLLVQGLGLDSDTFAGILRTYGYRTAAFYPPAVFFIDEELFGRFRDRQLEFEYARVEFADPHERAAALKAYLAAQPPEKKLFLWVHLFEPHEPYVAHDAHPFGERDVDRYDSEIALADDGIGEIVAAVRARRPNAVVIVTADHGEEFGEHHGRYHGTTVYEEQVRVPLVVDAPGIAHRRVETPVQTIDLLPTVLAALDIPRPPRIRGHNLSSFLASSEPKAQAAPAFAVTDDQALLADQRWRLVCARRAGACALYDIDGDPAETRDVAAENVERFASMKTALRRLEASQGLYEAGAAEGSRPWPDAIRRGLAGDGEAARDVAALLDDSDVTFRRKAAEVSFDLRRKEVASQLRLAMQRDEDDVVRRYCAVALTRLGEDAPRTFELLQDADPSWQRLAALALAENDDPRGASVLVAWWQSEPLPFARAREVLAALGRIRAKDAVPALVRSLDDVRLRPYVAEALGAIGQPSARAPLAAQWAGERYQNARVAIGEALVRLGAKRELAGPLTRFLGMPDPLPSGVELAQRADILPLVGGPSAPDLARLQASAARGAVVKLVVPRGGNGLGFRAVVRAHSRDGRAGEVRLGTPVAGFERASQSARGPEIVEIDPHRMVTLEFSDGSPAERFATLPPSVQPVAAAGNGAAEVELAVVAAANVVLEGLVIVPLADDLPPPPPQPWSPPPPPHP